MATSVAQTTQLHNVNPNDAIQITFKLFGIKNFPMRPTYYKKESIFITDDNWHHLVKHMLSEITINSNGWSTATISDSPANLVA